MSPVMTLVDFNQTMKDYYPRPGERFKQYVVDERIADEWDRKTCPRIDVPEHSDNCEQPCYVSGKTPWIDVLHAHSCSTCSDAADEARTRDDVIAWLARREKERPPICADKTKLSDEVATYPRLGDHPFLNLLKRK